MEQVTSILENKHSISCMATVTEIGISPASVYHILTKSSQKQKFVQVDSTHAQRWPISHARSSCQRPSAALEKSRQFIPQSHFNGWHVMDAFIWPSAKTTECWIMHPMSPRKKIAQRNPGAPQVTHVMFFSWNGPVLEHPMPVKDQHCRALLQDTVRLALHCKQP